MMLFLFQGYVRRSGGRIPFQRILLTILLGIVSVGLLDPMLAQEKGTRLAWKFKSGDEFDLSFDQLSQSDTNVLDRIVKIKIRLKMQVSWKVEEVDPDGNANIKQTIEWASMSMTKTNYDGGTKTINVDTRQEIEKDAPQNTRKVVEQILKDVKPIMGASVNFRISPRGKISDFIVPKETKEALRASSSSMEIRKLFTAEGMGSVLGPSAMEFPEDAIAGNGKWKTTRKITNEIGDFDQTFHYQVGEIEAASQYQTVVIQVASSTEKKKDGKAKVEIVSQSGTGSIKFDVLKGNIATSNFVTQVETRTKPRPDIEIQVKTRDEVMIEFDRK